MGKEQIINELKETIKEAGLTVIDIFSESDIKSTDVFKKEAYNAHEHARRVEKVLGEEREKIRDLTKELDDKTNKIKTLNEVVSKTQVKTLFDTAKENRKLDSKESAFIEKRLNTFKSDKEGDELKIEFEKFLDNQINDYLETAKLLGVEIKKDTKDNKGVESGDNKGGDLDYMAPENNELIP